MHACSLHFVMDALINQSQIYVVVGGWGGGVVRHYEDTIFLLYSIEKISTVSPLK
jgi:hypothetical protein